MNRTLRLSTVTLALAGAACVSGTTEPTGTIVAADVVDHATLKSFVDRAVAETEASVSTAAEAHGFFDATFRPVGEWHEGSTYLFVYELSGTCLFHAANPSLEGQDMWGLEDLNGVKIIQDLMGAAVQGGGYVEYLWDNPAIPGDEETGSPKVGYAALAEVEGARYMIGSGFYPQ